MCLASLYIINCKAALKKFYTVEADIQGCSHLSGALSGEGVPTLQACDFSLSSQISRAHWEVA